MTRGTFRMMLLVWLAAWLVLPSPGLARPADPDSALEEFAVDGASGTAAPATQAAAVPDDASSTAKVTRRLIAWRYNCLDANGNRVTKDVPGNTPYGGKDALEAAGFKILNSNPVFEYVDADGTVLLHDDTGAAPPPAGYVPKGATAAVPSPAPSASPAAAPQGTITRRLTAWRYNCLDAQGKRVTKDIPGTTPYCGSDQLEAEGFKILNSNPVFEYVDAGGKVVLHDDTGTAAPPDGYPQPGTAGTSQPAPGTPGQSEPAPPTQGPGGTVSLDVPEFCQYKNCPPLAWEIARMSCGPTSLAMVMKYAGKSVTPNDLVGPTKCTSGGSWCQNLTAAAQQYGFGKARWTGSTSLSWLKDQLRAGKPVLVLTTEYGGHFMVVKGFDAKGNIIANDPADTTRKVHRLYPVDTFQSMWQNSFLLS
ncbi:MAG: peptidase C39 family protein [Candidatus Riflebacteria bacterium]|nr:peptidase C39 family protein [Candidatus Riflebacteria bacterium]